MITSFFEYKLTLKSPTILTNDATSNPNSVDSLTFIPGSSVRGALASVIIKKEKDKKNDEDKENNEEKAQKVIENLILSESISFLPVYPEIAEARCVPMPLSIKTYKSNFNICDNLLNYSWQINEEEDEDAEEDDDENSKDWPKEQLKNCLKYVNLGSAVSKYYFPKVSGRFHNQIDSNKGRAWSNGKETLGSIFSYQSLLENQNFRGIIKISGDTKEDIKSKIKLIKDYFSRNSNTIFVGKSKHSGYGGNAEIHWIDEDGRDREFGSFSGDYRLIDSCIKRDEEFNILLTSPYIGRDIETGSIDPLAIIGEINAAFKEKINKVSFENVKICGSSKIIGGFNKKWECEIPQSNSLEAGTVIALKALQDISVEEWLILEQKGLGIRKNEGYGSFILLKRIDKTIRLSAPKKEFQNRPDDILPDNLVKAIEDKVVLRELEKAIVSKVANSKIVNLPPNHLLGRFRNLLSKNSEYEIIRELSIWLSDENNSLKEPAKKHLRDCKIDGKSLFKILKELIETDNIKNDSELNYLKNYFFIKEDIDKAFVEFKENNNNKIKIYYLNTLIKIMSLKNRTE